MGTSDTHAELVEACRERDLLEDALRNCGHRYDEVWYFWRVRLLIVRQKIVRMVGQLESMEGADK